jgi:hypothetical protein
MKRLFTILIGALLLVGMAGNTYAGMKILEQADATADTAAYGQFWVNLATPNEAWFTDDAGTDFQLGIGISGSDSVGYDETDGSFKSLSLVGDPDSWDITTALHYGGYMIASAAGEDTLDAAVVGMSLSLSARDTIVAIWNPNAADTIILNGVSLAQGEALISDDTAGVYSLVACVCVAANTWECGGSAGVTEENE